MSTPGINPIGTLIHWDKSLVGVPSLITQLKTEYVEDNGQVITDPNSPMVGKTLRGTNNNNRFIRGNSASGTTGGCATETLCQCSTAATSGIDFNALNTGTCINVSGNLPPYVNMVNLVRIK